MSQPRQESPDGLLLVAHGTRSAEGVASTFELCRRVRELVDLPVEVCFLELAEPALPEGLNEMARRGLKHIAVSPILLFSAGHAKVDIPAALADAAREHPGVCFQQALALESHPLVIEQSVRRFREAVSAEPKDLATDTLLVMVGRGSRDAEAAAEFARFARLRWDCHPTAWLETAFVAMAKPSLEQTTAMAARMGFGRVVVQPHLLFAGDLETRIQQHVAARAEEFPECQWITTGTLGPTELIAQALVDVALGRSHSD